MDDTKVPDYRNPIELLHDCEAILIPEGAKITLEKGMAVFITQALGGSITVNVNGNLARISEQNTTALGMKPPELKQYTSDTGNSGLIDDEVIWEQLSTCYDPEIPINIVELGLVYRCDVFYEKTGNRVEIDLTLTAPGCGMGPFLVDDIVSKVRQVPNVSLVDVELVFDPPWSQEMMSEAARLETGLY